jgi:hypothetical protein
MSNKMKENSIKIHLNGKRFNGQIRRLKDDLFISKEDRKLSFLGKRLPLNYIIFYR